MEGGRGTRVFSPCLAQATVRVGMGLRLLVTQTNVLNGPKTKLHMILSVS